jgi:hypothetical protein
MKIEQGPNFGAAQQERQIKTSKTIGRINARDERNLLAKGK